MGADKNGRNAMIKADPKPNTPVINPPKVDEYLVVFWKGKMNLAQHGELKADRNCPPTFCRPT